MSKAPSSDSMWKVSKRNRGHSLAQGSKAVGHLRAPARNWARRMSSSVHLVASQEQRLWASLGLCGPGVTSGNAAFSRKVRAGCSSPSALSGMCPSLQGTEIFCSSSWAAPLGGEIGSNFPATCLPNILRPQHGAQGPQDTRRQASNHERGLLRSLMW